MIDAGRHNYTPVNVTYSRLWYDVVVIMTHNNTGHVYDIRYPVMNDAGRHNYTPVNVIYYYEYSRLQYVVVVIMTHNDTGHEYNMRYHQSSQ